MNINAAGDSGLHANYLLNNPGLRNGQAKPANAQGEPAEDVVLIQTQDRQEPMPEASAAGETEDDGATGVLRLLQEGHFKGVADVRLRINFHEELTAMQNAAVQSAGQAALDEMGAAVGAAMDSLGGPEALTEEQQQTVTELRGAFDQAMADAGAALASGQETGQIQSDLQQAFDSLMAGLEPLFAPTEPPAPAEVPVDPLADQPVLDQPASTGGENATEATAPAEVDAEIPVEIDEPSSLLETLRSAFATAMTNLAESLTPVPLLPELSPPTGNGRAYEKFLAIYTSLQPPVAIPAQEAETVDVQA